MQRIGVFASHCRLTTFGRPLLQARGHSELSTYPAPRDDVDWSQLGFGLASKNTKMVVATCSLGKSWSPPVAAPYGPLSLEPAATILNYGQGIFEGMKAFRTEKGRIVLFRPRKNAQRLQDGAQKLLMPRVPSEVFIEAVELAVRENADWVPPSGEGALYLRPMLFGSGAGLGVAPSSEYTFLIYVSPVGSYFGPGAGGARMKLCREYQRAAPAGVGHIKCVGNYAQCFGAQQAAKADGFSDVIYLDAAGQYIEEAAASNFFCVTPDKVVHTPQLGAILPGVTRDSVLTLCSRARDLGLTLKVGQITPETVMRCEEAFLSGTGAGIIPIEHISAGEHSVDLKCPGPVTSAIGSRLSDIQNERVEDRFSWLHDPFQSTASIDSYIEPAF